MTQPLKVPVRIRFVTPVMTEEKDSGIYMQSSLATASSHKMEKKIIIFLFLLCSSLDTIVHTTL